MMLTELHLKLIRYVKLCRSYLSFYNIVGALVVEEYPSLFVVIRKEGRSDIS